MKQGWKIKKLGECFEYIKNGANIKQERGAGGIPITRIETLSGGVFNRDRLGYADIKTIDKYQSYVMESGDLLLSHINSKSYIGRVVVYVKEGDETIIHGMNLLRLKVIPDLISPFYMYYYSQTHKFKSQIANRRKDAVNQSSISVADLKTIDVPVPPRVEQERIVAELDCLSGVIEKKKQQLKELDALAQSIFYQMFGDPITNEKGWKVKKLEELCDIINGFAFPSSDFAECNPIKAIKITNVGVNEFISDDSSLPEEYNNMEGCKVHTGDIVIALTRTIISTGVKRAIVPNEYNESLVNQRVAAILANDRIVSRRFLYSFLGTDFVRQYILQKATALMQPNLSIRDLRDMPTIYPPLTLQQEFADKIEAIEKQKELIKQSITQTEELFNSRMDYYFN